jgi:hypothetical protein
MFLVRDWWPAGNAYISWVVDNMSTAYAEYSGTSPSSTAEFAGKLTLVRRVASSPSASSSTIPQSSIWGIPEASSEDIIVEYGIDGHTGAWGLGVAAESSGVEPLNDQGALILDDGEMYVGMLSDVKSGILNLSMLEVFPSSRTMPDSFWELSGEDLYLTGAAQ